MSQLPSFIGGFRSGTTLLINLIGMHESLVPWFETKELCEILRWLTVRADASQQGFEAAYCAPAEPAGFDLDAVLSRCLWQVQYTADRQSGYSSSGKASYEQYPLGHDLVRYPPTVACDLLTHWKDSCQQAAAMAQCYAATRACIEGMAEAQCASGPSRYWVNKTPEITRFAPQLRAVLGPCKIIYMVRNGLEVVASASRLGWGNVQDLAYNWQGLIARTRAGMVGHEQDYLELRYETLLADPEGTLNQVFRFLEVPENGAQIVAAFRQDRGADAFSVGKSASGEIPPDALRVFAQEAGAMQRALGYPMPVI